MTRILALALVLAAVGLTTIVLASPNAAAAPAGCDPTKEPDGNITTTFPDEAPPSHAFLNQTIKLPSIEVENRGGALSLELEIVAARGNTSVLLNRTDAQFGPDADATTTGPINLTAADAFAKEDSKDALKATRLLVCVDGKPTDTTGLDRAGSTHWTLERLAPYTLSDGGAFYEALERGVAHEVQIPTQESALVLTLKRGAPGGLVPYEAVESSGALLLAGEATPGSGCQGTPPMLDEVPSNRTLRHGGQAGWDANGGAVKTRINLSAFPACSVDLTFHLRLDPAHCAREAADACRVSEEAPLTQIVRQPWRFPSSGKVPDSSLPVTVWATASADLEDLGTAVDRFVEARQEAREAYQTQLAREVAKTERLRTAEQAYGNAVETARGAFEDIRADPPLFAKNLDVLEARFNATVSSDGAWFNQKVQGHLSEIQTESSGLWSTARSDFLMGLGAAFLVGSLSIAVFTVRWRRKTRYWSMFSSKANFTHPLRLALIIGAAAILMALVWGLVSESFALTRVLGLPIDILGVVLWI